MEMVTTNASPNTPNSSANESASHGDNDHFSQNPFDLKRYSREAYEAKNKPKPEKKENEPKESSQNKNEQGPKTILKKQAGKEENKGKSESGDPAAASGRTEQSAGDDKRDDRNSERKPGTRYRLKINGEEKIVSRPDLLKLAELTEDESKGLSDIQLVKIAQIQEASKIKFREVGTFKKKAQDAEQIFQQIEKAAKENPLALIQKLGVDLEPIITKRIEQMVQEAELTEEQLRLKRYEEQERLRLEQDEQNQKKFQTEEQQRKVNEYKQENSQKMFEAWKEVGLAPNPFFGAMMTTKMIRANQSGKKDFTWRNAASIVKKEFYTGTKELVSPMDAKQIAEIFGEEVMEKLRQHFLDLAKGKPNPQDAKKDENPKPPVTRRKQEQAVSELEWIDSFRSRYK